jgi:hypothetical protein
MENATKVYETIFGHRVAASDIAPAQSATLNCHLMRTAVFTSA